MRCNIALVLTDPGRHPADNSSDLAKLHLVGAVDNRPTVEMSWFLGDLDFVPSLGVGTAEVLSQRSLPDPYQTTKLLKPGLEKNYVFKESSFRFLGFLGF